MNYLVVFGDVTSANFGTAVVAMSVCLCVCLCVCLLSHISPLGLLFVVKMLPPIQRVMKVQKNCGVFCSIAEIEHSLPWMAIHRVSHFSCG